MVVSISNLQTGDVLSPILNNSGQVVYENIAADNSISLSIWQNGQVSQIANFTNHPTYGPGLLIYALNESGEVTGYQVISNADGTVSDTAITWQAGATTTLGLFQGDNPEPVAIDDSGRIYGNSTYTNYGNVASNGRPGTFVLQNGAMSPLGFNVTPPNFTLSVPAAIDAVSHKGDVLASVATTLYGTPTATSTNPNVGYAYLLKNGSITQLDISSTQDLLVIEPAAINDSDEVVGQEQNAIGLNPAAAFLYHNGKTQILSSLGSTYLYNFAKAISDAGLVVGYSSTGPALGRVAVVWQNGVATDLNTLLPINSGWVLTEADSINDSGQVVGVGQYNGKQSIFELTLPTQTYSAAAVAGEQQQGAITSVTAVSDTAANVSANLDALAAVAAQGDLGTIALADSGKPALTMSIAQMSNDVAVTNAISGSFAINIRDSAANISADLDNLQTVVRSGKVATISLTDSGIPTVSATAVQLSSDADAIKAISGNFTLVESAPAASAAIAGAANALGNSLTFIGDASQYAIKAAGDGIHMTVSGNGATLTLSDIQALKFADYTLIVAQMPGSATVTTGNITELYGAVFGREPDVPGLAYYQQELAANPSLSLTALAQGFLASPEYINNPANNYAQTTAGDTQFITNLYNNLLHRTPAAGDASWYEANVIAPIVGNAAPGTAAYSSALALAHAYVVTDFSQSAEFLASVQVTAQNPASAQHWLVLI